MSAQTYTHPIAIDRMRAGTCPECGGAPRAHGNDTRFWAPVNQSCSLMERGVVERIEHQLDELSTAIGLGPDAAAMEQVQLDALAHGYLMDDVSAAALVDDDAVAAGRPVPTEDECAALWGERVVDEAGPEESR